MYISHGLYYSCSGSALEKTSSLVNHRKGLLRQLLHIESPSPSFLMEFVSELTFSDLVYQSPDGQTRVMKGTWGDCPVAVKILQYTENAWKEACIQNSLSSLDSVCRIYSVVPRQESRELFVVMEWLEGDLNMEIERRAKAGLYWGEEELWGMFRVLIYTFATAQNYGISHRDIKPQNIFYTHPNGLKVGDFGCAKDSLSEISESIIGSPYFFSPELKKAFRTSIFCLPSERKPYNAFKSDVYSLGVTFLMMILLEPSVSLMNTDQLEANTMLELNKVPSEGLRTLLIYMLQPSEENRWDFMQLYTYMESLFQPAVISPEVIIGYLNSPQDDLRLYGLQQLMQSGVQVLPSILVYQNCLCGRCYFVPVHTPFTVESLRYCSIECYYEYEANGRSYKPNMQSVVIRPQAKRQATKPTKKLILRPIDSMIKR